MKNNPIRSSLSPLRIVAAFFLLSSLASGQTISATAWDQRTALEVSPVGLQFVPVTPCRIMDTRNPNGSFGGPFIGGGTTRSVPIPLSGCGIPSTAQAYALNITVIPRAGFLGYLTVWPTGQAQPVVSTLNSFDGSILANAAIVPAGADGSIDAFASNDTDLVMDIDGYFITPGVGSLQFYPLAPCRVLDTRNPYGTFGGPALTGGTSRSFPIPSSPCGAPGTAAAYSLNVTAVPHGSLGYLTAWPSGQSQPVVSTLNSFDGTILANAAIVPAGTGGAVSFFVTNTTDLVVDIDGYFAPPGTGGLNFYAVSPCRVVDTRNASGPLGGPIMFGNTTRTFPLAGDCGLPETAAAYSLNMTVDPPAPMGFLSVWPTGLSQPTVSTLNDFKGLAVANAALVPAGASGSINVFVTNTTDVLIDTNGYFQGPAPVCVPATMVSPAPGPLTSSTVTFTWNLATNCAATSYSLNVSTISGQGNVYSKTLGLVNSVTVYNIPTGVPIYVSLGTLENGTTWLYNNYTYSSNPVCVPAAIYSPPPGSASVPGALSSNIVTFYWNPASGCGATAYWLDVGTNSIQGSAPGQGSQGNIFSQNVGLVTSETVTGIPTNNTEVFVRLWTQVNGATWQYNDYAYESNPAANLVVTFMPNPVEKSSSGSWSFSITLQETGGVEVRLTHVAVDGIDETLQVLGAFNENPIPANGAAIAYLTASPGGVWTSGSHLFTFTGNDYSGNSGLTWSGTLYLQ